MSQLVLMADIYSAISMGRSYKDCKPHENALDAIFDKSKATNVNYGFEPMIRQFYEDYPEFCHNLRDGYQPLPRAQKSRITSDI